MIDGGERMPVLHHLQHQTRGHSERGDKGDVNAAPDDDDRHREAENAEHCDILQQGQHVLRGGEARKRDGEQGKQHHE